MSYILSMRITLLSAVTLSACLATTVFAQIRRTSVPLGDAVAKALDKGSLAAKGIHPFHVRVSISEPENPNSPYQGSIEEWWVSGDQWRREVTDKDGMHLTIVVSGGHVSEKDEGDYFPLWLRSFVSALFNPIPNTSSWTAAGMTIDQITMPNGAKSDACARAKSQIGSGSRATDAFSNVCFDGEGRLKFFGSPGYSMEFSDYRSFNKRQIPHKFIDHPEPGTELVGAISLLEEIKTPDSAVFSPLPSEDGRFRSVAVSAALLEQLTAANRQIQWPTVHSGNTSGHLSIYVGVDSNGHVREAWPLNSDNAGLEDSAREQARNWTIKPFADSSGNPVQVDGGLGFYFETAVADPIPVLTDQEARALAINIVEPKLPANTLPKGTRYRLHVSVNEEGRVAGLSTGENDVPGTVKAPGAAMLAASAVTRQWRFTPLMRNGTPKYFFADLVFTAD